MNYQLIRSKRKTVAIQIKQDGTIQVKAPNRLPLRYIEQFLREKQEWIQQHVYQMSQWMEQKQQFSIQPGDNMLLLGKEYPVQLGDQVCFRENNFYVPKMDFSELQPRLIQLYRELAEQIILPRVEWYTKKMGLSPTSVKISSAKKRWGSCSGTNRINFSWRLIMAPLSAVDYVVVHELCHMIEHNHSANFWKLVSQIVPNYSEQKQQLAELSHRLIQENWGD